MTFARRVPSTPIPIAGGVLLGIIALALHPHLAGHSNRQTVLRELLTLSMRDRLVHGTLLFLLGALLTGLTNYALHRGLTRRPIVAGLISFEVGVGALFAAGLIDGFILPEIVARFVSASPPAQNVAIATLTALSVVVNVCTSFAIVAMAIAIAAWSLDLAFYPGASRLAGIVGFVAVAVSVAALMTSGPYITPHGLLAVFGAQGVWYVGIALLLAHEERQNSVLRSRLDMRLNVDEEGAT